MPILTSGKPMIAVSDATRKSKHRDNSAPPPRQYPFIEQRVIFEDN